MLDTLAPAKINEARMTDAKFLMLVRALIPRKSQIVDRCSEISSDAGFQIADP